MGKGVCFDTGGLNLKPGASMGLMKKDMGGAATVMGLAQVIMALGLRVQLRVLIPAVENAVSSNSFRPGDILTSRKGLTVEINNTDAEGRLVLADALAFASEETPDLMLSMATLTGAARVAVGPDLAPYYSDDDAMAAALDVAARKVADPVWRMPFWTPYEKMIEPGIADLDMRHQVVSQDRSPRRFSCADLQVKQHVTRILISMAGTRPQPPGDQRAGLEWARVRCLRRCPGCWGCDGSAAGCSSGCRFARCAGG